MGQLRAALVGLPEHLPVVVPAAPPPGRADVDPQVVVDVGFGTHLPGGNPPPCCLATPGSGLKSE